MCSTPETIRSLSFKGEFNGPNQLPPGPITDDIILRYIDVTQRLRQQLIVDFGCARSGSNIVPDLIDLEVAHWLKLQMMLEGLPGQNPNPRRIPRKSITRALMETPVGRQVGCAVEGAVRLRR